MSGQTTYLKADTPSTADSGKDSIISTGLQALDSAIAATTQLTLTLATTQPTDVQMQCALLQLQGALTANRVVELPARQRVIWIANDTTGAFTVTVRSGSTGGLVIATGARKLLWIKNAIGGVEWLN